MPISTIKARLQMRRGLEKDFNPDNMAPGEWAVSLDKKYVRMCFAPGLCVRMATYEGFEADMEEVRAILAECQDIQTAVDAMADLAEQHKNDAQLYAKQAQSYAVGTGGARPNEANDNAKKYYEQSKAIYDNFNSAGDVTGVKGSAESAYRTGQVNITPANIGLGNVGNFKAVSTVASQGLSATEKSNAIANIGAASEGNTWLLSGGTAIPANADLNDYKTLGNYYCNLSDVANTLSNCPATHAFILKVELSTGVGYPSQTIRDFYNGKIYYRFLNGNAWTSWMKSNPPLINNLTTATAGQGALDAYQGKVLKYEIEQINSKVQPYASVPIGVTKVVNLPKGFYTLSSSERQKLTDLSSLDIGGRTIILASGTEASDEKAILVIPSKSSTIYYGHQYGTTFTWTDLNPWSTDNPIKHRNIYRGKNLGTSFTAAQKAAIADGSFKDLYVGDYWVINGVTWRIVDINYWLNTGDTACTTPHLVIMPDNTLYNAQMNATNTTQGGYAGSKMYTEGLEQAKIAINNAFGEANILNHREYLTNAVTNGYPSGGAWYDSKVELPNEIMMYGSYIFTPAGDGSFVPNRYTVDKTQLALMQLYSRFISPARQPQWLRDVVSSASFAHVGSNGNTIYSNASYSIGVRPVFGITGA